jgi:small subunit ribosomal protein S17
MANETTAVHGNAQGSAQGNAAEAPKERAARQELVGVVTSAKMEKTIVVKVTRATQHRLYHRVIRSGKKYYAHDETREARVGDVVRIVSTRPLSKLKRWRLKEVVARSTRA